MANAGPCRKLPLNRCVHLCVCMVETGSTSSLSQILLNKIQIIAVLVSE